MPSITPFLWFDDNAEEAVAFYGTVFDDVKVHDVSRSGEAGPGAPGTVLTIDFEVCGQRFIGLNGGPQFPFTEAFSLQVHVADQAEVDHYWAALTKDGAESECGWLKDKFGLSWQIVPEALPRLIGDADQEKAARAMQAMLKMQKIDIAMMQAAFDGAS